MFLNVSRISHGFKFRAFVSIGLLLSIYVNAIGISKNDGTTPLALIAGAPAGSYSLNNLEHINPFNGDLSLTVPLLPIGGRGTAQYTMFLPIEHKWIVDQWRSGSDPNQINDSLYRSGSATGYFPQRPFPLYEPGALFGRIETTEDDGTCANCAPWWGGSLTRLTFALSDGTEYELRDVQTGGKPNTGFYSSGFGPSFSRGTVFATPDGNSATFVSETQIVDPVYLGSSA